MVFSVRNRACAISRLVIPSAAIRATRTSEAVEVLRLSVRVPAGTGTGCDELLVGAGGDRVGAAGTGLFERLAEWLACVGAPAGGGLPRPTRAARARARAAPEIARALRLLLRAARSPGLPARRGQVCGAKRRAGPVRRRRGSARAPHGPAHAPCRGGRAMPAAARRRCASCRTRACGCPTPLEPLAGEQIFQRLVGMLRGRLDASARLQVADLARRCGLGLNLRKDFAGFGRLAPREHDVHERHAAVKVRAGGGARARSPHPPLLRPVSRDACRRTRAAERPSRTRAATRVASPTRSPRC